MKVCIAGGGRVGRYLAQSLLANRHEIVIIEPVESQCRMLADTLDIPVICGDSITVIIMPELPVYPPLKFKNKREAMRYNKLVYNVKKTLPIAKMVNQTISETYEYLEKLPTKKEKDAHIRAVEKGIKKQYTPQMKKLTYSQGKLLIKLVDRECNQSSFEIVKAFFGPFKAGFYQTFASIFGASLKKDYDPEADDRLTERVVRMVEAGTL